MRKLLEWMVPFGIIAAYFLVGFWSGLTHSP